VLIWRDANGTEHYATVRGGPLRVRGGPLRVHSGTSIEIATREATIGDDLKHLREVVLAQMTSNAESEKAARVSALGLQQAGVQQIYRDLRRGDVPGDPLVRKR